MGDVVQFRPRLQHQAEPFGCPQCPRCGVGVDPTNFSCADEMCPGTSREEKPEWARAVVAECPFCGGSAAEQWRYRQDPAGISIELWVSCQTCCAASAYFDCEMGVDIDFDQTREMARQYWNNRNTCLARSAVVRSRVAVGLEPIKGNLSGSPDELNPTPIAGASVVEVAAPAGSAATVTPESELLKGPRP
jgi:hypothetical protein